MKIYRIQLSEYMPYQNGNVFREGHEGLVWYDRSKRCWCCCLAGVSKEGWAYEGENITDFPTRQAALDYLTKSDFDYETALIELLEAVQKEDNASRTQGGKVESPVL